MDSNHASFGLNTRDNLLWDLTDTASRQRLTALHPNSPFPRDQMDLAPIRALLKEELVHALQAHDKQCVKELGDYLHHMRLFDLSEFQNLDSVVWSRFFEIFFKEGTKQRHVPKG